MTVPLPKIFQSVGQRPGSRQWRGRYGSA